MDKIFLQAVLESARDAAQTIDSLTALHVKNTAVISNMGRASKNALQLLGYLEANPIIEITKTARALNMAFNTVSAAIKRLCDAGILVQSSGEQRNRVFSYEGYLNLLREGT